MTIGDRIKKIRLSKNLNQTEFGLKVGLEQRTVSDYERGISSPGKGRLYLIAEKFGVNPEWLLTGKGEPYKTAEITPEDRAKIEREHIRRLFSELSPPTQRAVIDALKDMIEQDKLESACRNSIKIETINGHVSINNEGEK